MLGLRKLLNGPRKSAHLLLQSLLLRLLRPDVLQVSMKRSFTLHFTTSAIHVYPNIAHMNRWHDFGIQPENSSHC